MRTPWKPINFHGQINYDPRGEILARAHYVELNDDYVAIPLSLAFALSNLHECDSTKLITEDEDGLWLLTPMTIRCRKVVNHMYMCSNGYMSWDKEV